MKYTFLAHSPEERLWLGKAINEWESQFYQARLERYAYWNERPLADLGLNSRIIAALNYKQVWTVGALLRLSPSDVLRTPGIGRLSGKELIALLEAHGLALYHEE